MNVVLDISPLNRLGEALSTQARSEVLSGAAAYVAALVRSHIRQISKTHHKTANRLGAAPTGHLEDAAASVRDEVRGDTARIVIASPGFARALGPLDIRPKNARALTLPVHALAYGHRVGELKGNGWTFFRPKGAKALFGKGPDGQIRPMYALKAHVRLPQDRSLLPTDAAIRNAARTGAANAVTKLLERSL